MNSSFVNTEQSDLMKNDADVVSSNVALGTQNHSAYGKLTVCQQCRKPLPRCSICLMHLGTAAPSQNEIQDLSMQAHESILKKAVTSTRFKNFSTDCAQIIQSMSILNDNGGNTMESTNLNKTNLKHMT